MLDHFDQAYVINLPHRTDRRCETEAELAAVGLKERTQFHAASRPDSPGAWRSIGEHGCYLSHMGVWERSAGAHAVLVMEDDIAFASDFGERASIVDQLPESWDIAYLGHYQHESVRREWHETGVVRITPDVEFIGTHCYAVNGKAIARLREAADLYRTRPRGHPEGGVMSIDGAINIARRNLALETYAIFPALAFQRPSRTDIAELRWFDRIGLLQAPMRLARRAKHHLHAAVQRSAPNPRT